MLLFVCNQISDYQRLHPKQSAFVRIFSFMKNMRKNWGRKYNIDY